MTDALTNTIIQQLASTLGVEASPQHLDAYIYLDLNADPQETIDFLEQLELTHEIELDELKEVDFTLSQLVDTVYDQTL